MAKTLNHGEWTFEYKPSKNIFKIDENLIDSKTFKLYDINDSNFTNSSESYLDHYRKAATVHKIVRKNARSMLKPGCRVADLVDNTEKLILDLCKQNPSSYYIKGGNSGIAFPVGVNINNTIAHDSKTILIKEERTLKEGDVVKIDIGVHDNGYLIDSAFTHIVTKYPGITDNDNIYNSVLEASRDSMISAIAMSGPDVLLTEVSEIISEIINSYEIEVGSELLPIVPIKGLGGHNIKQHTIHAGKLILSVPDSEIQRNSRMEENEIYAIETFASTGYGNMTQNEYIDSCTHFMENKDLIITNSIERKELKRFHNNDLYNWVSTRNGLPFSYSWIPTTIPKIQKHMKAALEHHHIIAFPPLYDVADSVVAQFEHTIHVKDGGVEILSLGDDY